MKKQLLDLSINPRKDISEKILSVATALFDAVKIAPPVARKGLPAILRNNNFGLALRLTPQYAFLEITTKFHSQKSRELERLKAYRQIFTSISSEEGAIFRIDNARLVRIGAMTLEGPHAFAIGNDFSMCAWEVQCLATKNQKKITNDICIIYVVGFGERILIEDAWQEFDALIRTTLSEWSKN